MPELYVITAVFNPRQFASRYRLFREFKEYVEDSGAKLLTVECAYGERPHEVTDEHNPWDLRVRTKCELWHKERMLNLGIQRLLQLAPAARYVAWVDADLRFARTDWVNATIEKLQHHLVVQMFSEASSLGPKHQQMWLEPSRLCQWSKRGFHREPERPATWAPDGEGLGHPGFAWASSVPVLDALGGLFDVCIAGSGDLHMCNALVGDVQQNLSPALAPGMRLAAERWASRAKRVVQGNVGFVDGMCMHYWHGKHGIRGYEKRAEMMVFHQYDPCEDIYLQANGLYAYTGNKPRLESDIRLSMSLRNEDSTDL